MRHRRLGPAGALAVLVWSGAAFADDGGTAQALFDKGVADLEAGHPETACPALAESQRLDPRPGTLFALADCETAQGKIASALGHYHEYVGWVSRLPTDQQDRHAERVALSRSQIEALQNKVPTLVLALSASAPPGLVVERDGVALQGAALGVALPIDPGEHVVTSHAPGVPEERLTITMGLGDAKRIELPFRPTPPPSTAPLPPTTEVTSKPAEPAAAVADDSSQRTLGYVAGGVGIAGLLVGTITGILVLDRKKTVDDQCVAHACSPEGKKAADSGQTLAAISTIGFGVGIFGVGTGVALILTAPSDRSGTASIGVTGRF